MKVKTKGQVTLEYATIVALIFAIFVSMETFLKRGIQAHIKTTADLFGDQQGWKDGSLDLSDSKTTVEATSTKREFPVRAPLIRDTISESEDISRISTSISASAGTIGY